jgi:hypothetical protein
MYRRPESRARTASYGLAASHRSYVPPRRPPQRAGRDLGNDGTRRHQPLPLQPTDIPRIRELMRKYAQRPMDLADAALHRVAEREGIRKIFTVDRKDFSVYRLHNHIRPTLLP